MTRDIQEGVVYALFALAALYITLPIWRIPLVGLDSRLDEFLSIRCLF